MGHTPPLEKRSDEKLRRMLDKGLGVRTVRRVKTILRRRAQNKRQWLFQVAVAALIIILIVWALAIY
jgi:hypothetical protein